MSYGLGLGCVSCDVGAETGELQIAELQQMPWAKITDGTTMLTRGRADDKLAWPGDPTSPSEGSHLLEGQEVLEERPRKLVDGAYYSGQWSGKVRHG